MNIFTWFKALSIWLKVGVGIALLLAIVLGLLLAGLLFTPNARRQKTPAGYEVNSTYYLALDEQTQVWISVWLPKDLQAGEKIPAVIETSRYGERFEAGWLNKISLTYSGGEDFNYGAAQPFVERGYAWVWVQSPGTGQSTGAHEIEYAPIEVEAMRKAVEWIVAQPWSNQRVGGTGISYSGTTADMLAATQHPAVKAVVPLSPDFDPYVNPVLPGGVMSAKFISTWRDLVNAMDKDDICALAGLEEEEELSAGACFLVRGMYAGLKRPQGRDRTVYLAAIEARRNQPVNPMLSEILLQSEHYKDTDYGGGYTFEDIALYQYQEELEAAQVNVHTVVGWFDAGVAEGALQKYLTFDTPQSLVIHPADHTFDTIIDPFGETQERTPEESEAFMEQEVYGFLDTYLKASEEIPPQARTITYYTLGENAWHTTEEWPPQGVQNQTLYLNAEHSLSNQAPVEDSVADSYTVDFSASTGEANRWMAQMGIAVNYPDRRSEDEKLLTYTSAPLQKDLEITGSPTIRLYIASTHADGAVHVYLEDVAPDGRVTYITEGVLRLIYRHESDSSSAPFTPLGVYHSFHKEDTEPMPSDTVEEVAITLYPISVLLKKGHSLRIAIAGHDQAMDARYPASGEPTLSVERNNRYPSHIELPVREP